MTETRSMTLWKWASIVTVRSRRGLRDQFIMCYNGPNVTRRVGEGWEGALPQPASPSCQPFLRSVLLFSSSIHSLSKYDRQGSAGGARVSPSGRPNLRDTPIPGSYIPEQSLLRNRCAEGRGTFTPEQVSPVLRPRGAEVKSVCGGGTLAGVTA